MSTAFLLWERQLHWSRMLRSASETLGFIKPELPTLVPEAPTGMAGFTRSMTKLYDCLKCPGYCCSYPVIVVSRFDLARIARHFAMTDEEAERRFTTTKYGYRRIMRRKKDTHFGRICRFFDTKARRCTIYEARPRVCRSFPGEGRCGYYDFLRFERNGQNDPDYVSTTWHHED